MKKGNIVLIAMTCVMLAGLGGCTLPQGAAEKKQETVQEQTAYAVFVDDTGKTITLQEKPKRVVVLSTSLMNMAAAVDGDLAGRASVKSEDALLPERYRDVPEVGPVYNISAEKIVSLQPDLVLANALQHQKLIPVLEQNHIPVAALRSKNYDDVKRNLQIAGQIYGRQDVAQARIEEMDEKIAAITAKLPEASPKIAIIHATPSNVTVELQSSIAGNIAQLLHLTNVAVGENIKTDSEKIPYSIETLAAQNPDIIFFTSMGPKDKVENTIIYTIRHNPAWNSLQAVQKGKVFVLPEHYFLLNPGLAYPQAVAYMARLAYPGVFDE